MTAPTFTDWLRERHGPNWVVAPRTTRIVERYGRDVVCFSKKGFAAEQEAYRAEVKKAAVAQLCADATRHGWTLEETVGAAIRTGRELAELRTW